MVDKFDMPNNGLGGNSFANSSDAGDRVATTSVPVFTANFGASDYCDFITLSANTLMEIMIPHDPNTGIKAQWANIVSGGADFWLQYDEPVDLNVTGAATALQNPRLIPVGEYSQLMLLSRVEQQIKICWYRKKPEGVPEDNAAVTGAALLAKIINELTGIRGAMCNSTLTMLNKNNTPRIETANEIVTAFRRVGFPHPESSEYAPDNDYMYDQVLMPPVVYPEADWSGKKLFDAVRLGYQNSISYAGKLPVNNVAVGQQGTYSFRHKSDGTVGYGTALEPYGTGGVVGLGGGMVKYTNGVIPLVIDENAQSLNPLKALSSTEQRIGAFLNLTDGASTLIELAVPMPLERIYIISAANRGGYDDVVLDAEITKEDGSVVQRKLYKYNYYWYGQNKFGDLGAIAKIKLLFKTASQVKGFKARNVLLDGKLLEANLVASGIGVPVTDMQYIQLYALNNYTPFGYGDADLTDVTAQYKVSASGQAAALAGTSVINLLDPSSTIGWVAAAINQPSNAFNFELIDPLAQNKPHRVEIEFFENEAYKAITQIVVTTTATNTSDLASISSNTKRYTLDPAFTPTAGNTAIMAIEVHPNLDQFMSNKVTITVSEGNATAALAIKAVRIFA